MINSKINKTTDVCPVTRMNMRKCAVCMLLLTFFYLSAMASFPSLSEVYTWRNLSIGGGGYMTGIKIHPQNADLIYLRTDVGGCYRYDKETQKLVQLITSVPYEECNLYGINGIALDPMDENIVYIAAGKYPDKEPSDVFKSVDQGKTWMPMSLNKTWGANFHPFRTGNLLEVNPHTRELWAGTLGDGLWKYSNGKWVKITSIPNGRYSRQSGGNVAEGPIAICFDPADPDYVYVAVRGNGVYRSSNGGNDFIKIGNIPSDFYDLSLSKDGDMLFVAINDKGIYRLKNCRNNDSWENVSFQTEKLRVRTVTCSPHDNNILISANAQHNCLNRIFISHDGGTHWKKLNGKAHNIVNWHPESYPGSAISQFAFDPFDPVKVYFTDWYSFYKTENILADPVMWDNRMSYGHEEMVPVILTSNLLPNSQQVFLYVGGADLSALQITDLDRFSTLPNIRSLSGTDLLQEVSGIDCYEHDPDIVAFCGGEGWTMKRGGLALSDNGGRTLRMAEGYLPQWGGGKVVISGNDPQNLVVATQEGIRYTVDGGKTFMSSEGTSGTYIRSGIFQYVNPLCADKVNGNFYLYDRKSGNFMVSTDKGKSFVTCSKLPVAESERKLMIVAPSGIAGHLFAALGSKGLFFSDDSGKNWRKLSAFADASLIALGKEAPGETYPAIYIWGKSDKKDPYRFYRSIDGGKNWSRVNDEAKAGNETQAMCADKNVFGRFYVATNGTGVFIAELKNKE